MDAETAKRLKPGDTVRLMMAAYPGWEPGIDYRVAESPFTIIGSQHDTGSVGDGVREIVAVKISDGTRELHVSCNNLAPLHEGGAVRRYAHSEELGFAVLAGGGMDFYAGFIEGIRNFGDDCLEGVSGRAKYIGGGSQHRGTGSLSHLFFRIEYDMPDDMEAIKERIKRALTTEHGGVL